MLPVSATNNSEEGGKAENLEPPCPGNKGPFILEMSCPHRKGSPQRSLPAGKWSNPVPDGVQDDHLHPSDTKAMNIPHAFYMSNIYMDAKNA